MGMVLDNQGVLLQEKIILIIFLGFLVSCSDNAITLT